MTMRRGIPVVALAAAALALAGCGSDESSTGTTTEETTSTGESLSGSVGPGFEITLDQTAVVPGTYTLTVDDKSSSHNFHLTGPGVDVTTDVGAMGTETFDVTLKNGTYKFVCDPHASSMNGTLTVA